MNQMKSGKWEFVEAFGREEIDILGTCPTNMEGCYALDVCNDHENE